MSRSTSSFALETHEDKTPTKREDLTNRDCSPLAKKERVTKAIPTEVTEEKTPEKHVKRQSVAFGRTVDSRVQTMRRQASFDGTAGK